MVEQFMEKITCPVCSQEAKLAASYSGGVSQLNCIRCGGFEIGNIAMDEVSHWSKEQRINLSGWIRENQGCKIVSSNLNQFVNLRNLTVAESAEKILMVFAKSFPRPGTIIFMSAVVQGECLAAGRLGDAGELQYFIRDYLHIAMGFLSQQGHAAMGERFAISPKGWAHVESLRFKNLDSQIGFIAMWFDARMNDVCLSIEKAIRITGYDSLRIDQKQHNNKIDDEIVAAIRRSKFLVADFTGQRGGVYYEAGFAHGLNLSVIWLCREDELKHIHFDTRQYNFIVWQDDKLDELSTKLQNRIEATIGRGSLVAQSA